MKQRKTILIVDHNLGLESLLKEPLLKQLENTNVLPTLVHAKDGPEAATKTANQKFDVILIDTEVPRLMDGGFVYGLSSYKNTQSARLIVLTTKEKEELPENLHRGEILKKPLALEPLLTAVTKALASDATSSADPEKSAPPGKHVDVRVINAIIKATTNVIKQMGVATVTMEKGIPKSPAESFEGDVASVIDIKSNAFTGYMGISFDKKSYLEVVSHMLMEEQTELNSENQEAVGEINNIIFGNSKSDLTQLGVQLTQPRVLTPPNQKVPHPAGSVGMMIPFSTEKGKFYITVVAF